ncbi:uncharacterized protein BJ171DRAFT_528236 [Polychytrium aggregatum]|uniref:uncharacterized protein n=1 Tax=Polychytrium aggregatum TaxID=110093 RepID=UPI0022FF2504|nr:uncharacterized protein BJ171DRAFT_528236 [Polychytrium aggregatum]KAI9193408.1 hypothetical protein BJ171DRAFT_528236 [Polychytrium aggregatum]
MTVLTEHLIFSKLKGVRTAENAELSQIHSLNLWGQELTDVSILADLGSLRVVSLAINSIQDIVPLSKLTALKEVYLRRNQIQDYVQVAHLRNSRGLEVLGLAENPIAGAVANAGGEKEYRIRVLAIIPWIKKIDDRLVEEPEKAEAHRIRLSGWVEEILRLAEVREEAYWSRENELRLAEAEAGIVHGSGVASLMNLNPDRSRRKDLADKAIQDVKQASDRALDSIAHRRPASNAKVTTKHKRSSSLGPHTGALGLHIDKQPGTTSAPSPREKYEDHIKGAGMGIVSDLHHIPRGKVPRFLEKKDGFIREYEDEAVTLYARSQKDGQQQQQQSIQRAPLQTQAPSHSYGAKLHIDMSASRKPTWLTENMSETVEQIRSVSTPPMRRSFTVSGQKQHNVLSAILTLVRDLDDVSLHIVGEEVNRLILEHR